MDKLYTIRIEFSRNADTKTRIEKHILVSSPRRVESALKTLLEPFEPIYSSEIGARKPEASETDCGFKTGDGELFGAYLYYLTGRNGREGNPATMPEIRQTMAAMLDEIQAKAKAEREAEAAADAETRRLMPIESEILTKGTMWAAAEIDRLRKEVARLAAGSEGGRA